MASNNHIIDLTDDEPPRKKAKVSITTNSSHSISRRISLDAPISPPKRRSTEIVKTQETVSIKNYVEKKGDKKNYKTSEILLSPFQLTRIRGLSPALNHGTVTLKSILCDPMISECWEFNYLHDLDFLMNAFDPDTRDSVKIHVVHGFWKQEDAAGLKMQAAQYKNITLHAAYMPEMFGTHHTKMMVLLRYDDQAQVVIHTANMISQDWTNLTQAVWKSPLLPLLKSSQTLDIKPSQSSQLPPFGSGERFKFDFLNYLRAYNKQRTICKSLIAQLSNYDFSAIRGALIGSVPGRHHIQTDNGTLWGWPALQEVLKSVCLQKAAEGSEVVAQISSIATLGQTDAWIQKTFLKALGSSKQGESTNLKLGIVFPTADEIRRSLDGYQSGCSIHMKIQTPAQAKQFQYLKPHLYHWAGDGPQHTPPPETREAGRKRAAPHIKTYIRFSNASKSKIDWALVTSANISKQAWGEARNSAGDVRISSYELGVLVTPEMYGEDAVMVPTFETDVPDGIKDDEEKIKTVIGFRMPYDLPLIKYGPNDEPWCATKAYTEPDWMGRLWRT